MKYNNTHNKIYLYTVCLTASTLSNVICTFFFKLYQITFLWSLIYSLSSKFYIIGRPYFRILLIYIYILETVFAVCWSTLTKQLQIIWIYRLWWYRQTNYYLLNNAFWRQQRPNETSKSQRKMSVWNAHPERWGCTNLHLCITTSKKK